jgi:glycosyltransferase involved in cell wall biosynthesis
MTAYIVYNPQGGTEGHSQGYATNLCVGLTNNGVSVHLVTSRDFDAADVTAKGVELSYTDIDDSRKTTVRYDSWVSKLRYGAFIVANNFRSFGALSSALAARPYMACLLVGGETLTNIIYILLNYWRRRVVFALTIHNADYVTALYTGDKVKLAYKVVSKFFLKLLTHTRVVIFVHGEAMQKALATQLRIPEQRISIYKVPAQLVVQAPAEAGTGPSGPVRLLFCGVVRHDKGFDLLCEALSRCKPIADWRLRIAGSVRQVGKDYIRGLTAQHGIAESCSFNLKYLSSDEIDQEFKDSDIVVLPYRRSFIAQSVVMTDAVRWRRPVVVSEHSQNGYDAQKYGLGWVFTSEVVDSLEAALKTAIRDHAAAPTAAFGFTRFMDDHSPSSVGRNIIAATASSPMPPRPSPSTP